MANVKLGNNVLTGANSFKLQDADHAGEFVEFSSGSGKIIGKMSITVIDPELIGDKSGTAILQIRKRTTNFSQTTDPVVKTVTVPWESSGSNFDLEVSIEFDASEMDDSSYYYVVADMRDFSTGDRSIGCSSLVCPKSYWPSVKLDAGSSVSHENVNNLACIYTSLAVPQLKSDGTFTTVYGQAISKSGLRYNSFYVNFEAYYED